jgi:hypothetical protein
VPAIVPLTPSSKRALVATSVDAALSVDMGAALLVADTLDAVSAGVCRAAGMTDDEARAVLAILWTDR